MGPITWEIDDILTCVIYNTGMYYGNAHCYILHSTEDEIAIVELEPFIKIVAESSIVDLNYKDKFMDFISTNIMELRKAYENPRDASHWNKGKTDAVLNATIGSLFSKMGLIGRVMGFTTSAATAKSGNELSDAIIGQTTVGTGAMLMRDIALAHVTNYSYLYEMAKTKINNK